MFNTEEHTIERKIYQPTGSPKRILLISHGAGAGNQHHFMQNVCEFLAEQDTLVISFNFPYMQQMYNEGKRRPPNTNKILVQHFKDEIKAVVNENTRDLPIFIAGKSMGGRIASQIGAEADINGQISGIIVFGYPFIPPGKPEKLNDRIRHFPNISVPMLICQGERDSFGGTSLMNDLILDSNIELCWITSGDHGYKPLKSSGLSELDNIKSAANACHQFMQQQANPKHHDQI